MCACGCFILIALAAAFAYCVIHHLWLLAAVVVTVGLLIGFLGYKTMKHSS